MPTLQHRTARPSRVARHGLAKAKDRGRRHTRRTVRAALRTGTWDE